MSFISWIVLGLIAGFVGSKLVISPSRLSRAPFSTRLVQRRAITPSTTASTSTPPSASHRSARCISATMASTWSAKKYERANENGTPTSAAPASVTKNFQKDTRAIPAVRNAAARSPMMCRAITIV